MKSRTSGFCGGMLGGEDQEDKRSQQQLSLPAHLEVLRAPLQFLSPQAVLDVEALASAGNQRHSKLLERAPSCSCLGKSHFMSSINTRGTTSKSIPELGLSFSSELAPFQTRAPSWHLQDNFQIRRVPAWGTGCFLRCQGDHHERGKPQPPPILSTVHALLKRKSNLQNNRQGETRHTAER